jgi:hypothetical protein
VAGGLGALASAAPALATLELASNRIASAEELRALAALPALTALELDGCPLAAAGDADAYRAAVFAALPQLRRLDKRAKGQAADAEGCARARRMRARHGCGLRRVRRLAHISDAVRCVMVPRLQGGVGGGRGGRRGACGASLLRACAP